MDSETLSVVSFSLLAHLSCHVCISLIQFSYLYFLLLTIFRLNLKASYHDRMVSSILACNPFVTSELVLAASWSITAQTTSDNPHINILTFSGSV